MLTPAAPTSLTATPPPLTALVTLTPAPTSDQLCFLVAMLRQHEPTATKFAETELPLTALFGPGEVEQLGNRAKRIFTSCCPILFVEWLRADGRRERRASFTMMPLMSFLSYQHEDPFLTAQLNDALIPYLPVLLDQLATQLMQQELRELQAATAVAVQQLAA